MRGTGGVVAAVALLAVAAPAQARSIAADYRATGELRATWTTAAGERGSVTQSLATRGTVSIDLDGGASFNQGASSDGATAIVRVERDVPGGGREVCVDPLPSEASGVNLEPADGLRVRVGLRSLDAEEGSSLSSGRCAGPLEHDLEPLIPARTVDLRRARRRPVTVNLRGRRPFTAGGVSGTFVSTVVVRFDRGRRRRRGDSFFSRAQPAQAGTDSRLDGALTTAFRGGDPLACRLLDACAVDGTSTLRLVDVEVSPGFAEGRAGVAARAVIDSRVRRPGAPDCVDHAERPVMLELVRRPLAGGREQLRLVSDEDAGLRPGALLRTRCTGPADEDLKGRVIAQGEGPPADGRIVLRANRSLRGGPFAGGQSGELVLTPGDGP